MQGKDSWNSEALNQHFKFVANDAWQYLKKCKSRVEKQPSYEVLIDGHTAKYLAYDYFVDRTFLASRAAMERELNAIENRNHVPSDIYDAERYNKFWRAEIARIRSAL